MKEPFDLEESFIIFHDKITFHNFYSVISVGCLHVACVIVYFGSLKKINWELSYFFLYAVNKRV